VTEADEARLSRIAAAVLGIPEGAAPAASADSVSTWDSLAHLNLLMAVEQEFGVRFGAQDIADLDSVPRIRAAIEVASGGVAP